MAKRPNFVLNFKFVGNAQSQTASRPRGDNAARGSKGRFASLDNYARVIVEDVALNTANRTYKLAKASLETNIQSIVAKEISMMAKMIAKFMIQPEGARGPKGTIKAANNVVSQQAKSLWGAASNFMSYEVGKSNAVWHPRSKRWMAYKKDNGYSKDWWQMTGQLRKALANESMYADLGPVAVSFTKGGNEPKGPTKQTTSGRSGNVSATYSIGQLNVSVFGRITADMLPSLIPQASLNEVTPYGAKFIPDLFMDKETRNKLIGKGDYRPVVEPFISYYLTRAIPNAIFARTEKLISDVGANAKGF